MDSIIEYQVLEAGRGGKVKITFPSGYVIFCKKQAQKLLITAEHQKNSSSFFLRRIGEEVEFDDIDSIFVSDSRGTFEQGILNKKEALKSRGRK